MRCRLLTIVVLSVVCFVPGLARAGVLTFDSATNPGGDLFALSSYNGIFENVTFSGGGVTGFNSTGTPMDVPFNTNLSWNDGDFGGGDVTGVVWIDDPDPFDDASFVASITITADPGYLVRIDSFKLAGFTNGPTPSLMLKMYADDFTHMPFWTKNNGVPTDTFLPVSPVYGPGDENGFSQIILQWSNPYDIAIDDIEFTVGVVPEPGTLALCGLGLAGLGFVAYRRRRVS